MKNKGLYLAAAAAVLVLAGCKHELQTRTFELEDSVDAENFDASCNVSCSFEYVTGGVSQEVMDKINASIIANHLLFDEADGATDVPAACKQWAAIMLNGYSGEIEGFASDYDENDSWMLSFEYGRTGQFGDACKSRHLQTYTAAGNSYTGGAHGMYGIGVDVFDMTTGEIVREEDLFAEGYEEGVAALLATSLEKYLAEAEEDADMMFGEPVPNGNFGVSEEGVTWTFNPYEIAPYALGIIDLSVSWADLKPYLK